MIQKDFLDSFFAEFNDEFQDKRVRSLHRDYPHFKLDPVSILYGNQEYVRNLMNNDNLLHTYYNKNKSNDRNHPSGCH